MSMTREEADSEYLRLSKEVEGIKSQWSSSLSLSATKKMTPEEANRLLKGIDELKYQCVST